MRYLKSTKDQCLEGDFSDMKMDPTKLLSLYTDADFAGDKVSRKSVSGSVILFGGFPVATRSAMQLLIAEPATESEHIAVDMGLKDLRKVIYLVKDLTGVSYEKPLGTTVHCDNQPAIAVSDAEIVPQRTKHLDIRYKKVREYVRTGQVKLRYVNTKDNIANALTKAVPRAESLRLLRGDARDKT